MDDSCAHGPRNHEAITVVPSKVSSDELTLELLPKSKLQFAHFVLRNITEDESLVLHGKTPMMRPPEHYVLPDPRELEIGVNFVEQWMLDNKLIRKYETEKRAKTRLIAKDLFILALACFPEEKLTSGHGLLLVTAIQLIFVVDDIIEESDLFGRNESMGAAAYGYICEILKGNHDFDPDENIFPALRPAAKAAQSLIQIVQAQFEAQVPDFQTQLPDIQARSVHFKAAVMATYLGVYLLQVADRKPAKTPGTQNGEDDEDHDTYTDTMPEATFIHLRRADAAGLPSIEIMLQFKQVQLAPEIRENLLFKRCLEVAEIIVGHQNDLLGLEKDVKNDEFNIVLFKMKKYGMTLADSFRSVVEQVEELIKEFVYLESRLRRLSDNNEELKTFFEIVYSVMDANGYLLLYTERHGDLRAAFTKVKG